MNSMLRSVLFSALMIVGGACASNSEGSAGTGVASDTGGTSSAGGAKSRGGSGEAGGTGGGLGAGGTSSAGGAKPSGGSGEAAGTGGGLGAGGTSSAGGAKSSGGSGEAAGTGGGLGPGGTSSAGGAKSSGGSGYGAGGTRGSGGSGGAKGSGGAAGNGGVHETGGVSATGGAKGTTASSGGAPSGGGSKASGGAAAGGSSGVLRSRTIQTRGFTFDALETSGSGEPVLLLHGFPDTSLEWTGLMPVLAANGYHCLAPDQRGYSPGARPTEVDAYKYEELVEDAFAIASELGDRFHLIGHDWGTNIGWLMLEKDPSRIASFTAISIPHYQVWARSVYDDPAMAGYLAMLNDWMVVDKGESIWTAAQMRSMWKAKPADQREATIAHMTEPGAMTAALNWYRASDGHKSVIEDFAVWTVNVPTLLIHGSTDIGERSITETAPLMTGPYRVVRPVGGHFIVDEQPKAVADETLAHLRAYPIQ